MDGFLHTSCFRPERAASTALRLPGLGLSVSYAGLAAAVSGMAALLREGGVRRGARIALAMAPSLEFAAALLAGSRLGAAVAPIDISLRGLSLEDALARLAPDAVIAAPAAMTRLPERCAPMVVACKSVAAPEPAIVGSSLVDGADRPFHIAAIPDGADGAAAAIADGVDAQDDVLLIATSGSTGQSKFVRLGHRGTLFNMAGHLASLGLTAPFTALQALGGNYSYGLIPSFLAPLTIGGTVVVPANSAARTLRDTIAAERPSVCLATPALIEHLIDTCPADDRAVLDTLQKLGIGGDACSEQLRRKIGRAMPTVAPYITYGATEAGPRIATLPPEHFLTRPASVGLPLADVAIKVTDATGRPVAAGATGRLAVRTPSRMNGYLGVADPAEGDDWLWTGDVASLAEDGYLTVHGRAGRAFKHRGRLLDPSQIEAVLARYPDVILAWVEPISSGDDLRAVVHYRPGADRDKDLVKKLFRHCRCNLPGRLVPQEIVTVPEDDAYFFKGRRLLFNEAHV